MILSLFGFLIAVSLVLIIIGLTKPSESAQSLIGFFFMFILALVIVNGNLEYETGANLTTNITYSGGEIDSTTQKVQYEYRRFDDTNSRNIGIYLAIASGVGFAGVMWSLKKSRREAE